MHASPPCRRDAGEEMIRMEFFFDYSAPTVEPAAPLAGWLVAVRKSDILLADAFDTDVPVLAWAKIEAV